MTRATIGNDDVLLRLLRHPKPKVVLQSWLARQRRYFRVCAYPCRELGRSPDPERGHTKHKNADIQQVELAKY